MLKIVSFCTAWINDHGPSHAGHVMSAAFVILGSLVMVLIDVHKKNLREKRRTCKQSRLNQHLQQQVNEIKTWSPKELFDIIANSCFEADCLKRSPFSKIVEFIQEWMLPDEIRNYNKRKEDYHATYSENILGYSTH